MPDRPLVFLSHATPADNEVAMWYAAKLRQRGYRVFLDLDSLPPGSDFWSVIERTVRDRVGRFILLLSRNSNRAPGVLNEIQVATAVERELGADNFILPVAIDDMPAREANIQIARRQIVKATELHVGLRAVLDDLRESGIPQEPYTRETELLLSDRTGGTILREPAEHSTNWFRILEQPSGAFAFSFRDQKKTRFTRSRVPGAWVSGFFITFADEATIRSALDDPSSIRDVQRVPIGSLEADVSGLSTAPYDLSSRLLRSSFQHLCEKRNMRSYRMAGRATCVYFPQGILDKNRVDVPRPGRRVARRNVSGYGTSTRPDGTRRVWYWHYGMSTGYRSVPFPLLVVHHHVLFSDDGRTIWDSTARLQRARRRECKDWWNDEWRDRLEGSMAWLSSGSTEILIPAGEFGAFRISSRPVQFTSDVTYRRGQSGAK